MIPDFLLEPLQFAFMTRAFLGTALIAILSAMVGVFIVLKGLAFLGDAIAHTSFGGLALALLLGFNLYIGAAVFAFATAVGVALLNRSAKIKNDTALAIIFTGAFSIGVILIAFLPSYSGDLSALLLGSVLGIRPQELYVIGAAVLVTALVLWRTFEHLVYISFDPVGAEAAGLPVLTLQILLMALVALAIVVSIQAVGVILVMALLITPAATAMLFTRRLLRLMLLAGLFGLTATTTGLYLAYYIAAPPGAAMVLVATTQFIVGLLVKKLQTRIISWRLRRSRAATSS